MIWQIVKISNFYKKYLIRVIGIVKAIDQIIVFSQANSWTALFTFKSFIWIEITMYFVAEPYKTADKNIMYSDEPLDQIYWHLE